MQRVKKLLAFSYLSSLFFYLSILIFIISFNFTDTPPPQSGWYQQWIPNLGGRSIADITFVDSLIGYAVTPYVTMNDTVFVLKTTNGGDNWINIYTGTAQFPGMKRIKFINPNTGYCCGAYLYTGSTQLVKTTNGGVNWFSLNTPDPFFEIDDISILNEDTIWLAVSDSPSGGVFRTTNGGINWTRVDLWLSGGNPNKIYMYNRNIGFASSGTGGVLYRTTNSGVNWNRITGADGFIDIYFIDSLVGWKSTGVTGSDSTMKKTTNGGLTWFKQQLPPQVPPIMSSVMLRFTVLNKDSIWGVGGAYLWGHGQYRGIIWKTTNGGINWGYQKPDSSIHIVGYTFCKFVNKFNGWVYEPVTGIHTTTGGDTITYYTGSKQTSNNIPQLFKLFQNYPNPFNIKTIIRYELRTSSFVTISVYDITGRHVTDLVNQRQEAGIYEADFTGNEYASGVYFYSMYADGELIGSKQMVFIK